MALVGARGGVASSRHSSGRRAAAGLACCRESASGDGGDRHPSLRSGDGSVGRRWRGARRPPPLQSFDGSIQPPVPGHSGAAIDTFGDLRHPRP